MDSEGSFAKTPALEFFETDGAPGVAAIEEALASEIATRFGPRDEEPFAIIARSGGAPVGGLEGVTHWRWLYVRRLWVETQWRGKGLGRRLMAEAEARARLRLCVGAYVDTFDEGAANFYRKCGFQQCGRIEHFPPGAKRIFLMKYLSSKKAE
jgi:GNAT superfamily N-acetyltransferase